jgi:hypothetical protein
MSRNPFQDPQPRVRTSFSAAPIRSPQPGSYPQPQRGYPPRPTSFHELRYDDGAGEGDVGYGGRGSRGGVDINGRHLAWVAGEEDDELKPLNARWVSVILLCSARAKDEHTDMSSGVGTPFLPYEPHRPGLSTAPSSGTDFIRRQTIPKRGATTKRVKLTGEGHWINE